MTTSIQFFLILGIPIHDPEQSEPTEHGESGTTWDEEDVWEQGKGPTSSSETELPACSSDPLYSGMYLKENLFIFENKIPFSSKLPSELFEKEGCRCFVMFQHKSHAWTCSSQHWESFIMRNVTKNLIIDLNNSITNKNVPTKYQSSINSIIVTVDYLAFSQSLVTLDTRIGRLYSLPPLIEMPRVPSEARVRVTVLRPELTLYVSSSSQIWNSSLCKVM